MVYDCVGIGVGPSNLSVASLAPENHTSLFFDQRPEFSWHSGQLLDEASLQVSIYKDLVTLADPTNKYTFLNYLHSSGRIYHFLSANFDQVYRKEFSLYYKWVCGQLSNVEFDEEVKLVDFDGEFIVETSKKVIKTRNLSIGVGRQPYVPFFVRPHLGESQFHVSSYLHNRESLRDRNVAIVGGGQSGAEVFLDLLTEAKRLELKGLTWITRRSNFAPMDDSSFTNDIYMPCHVDYINKLNLSLRKEYINKNILTSDGISETTLREIYQGLYKNKFIDASELECHLLPARTVTTLSKANNVWRLDLEHSHFDHVEEKYYDAVVWATGFENTDNSFLAPIEHRIEKIENEFLVDNTYAAKWDGPSDRNLFFLNSVLNQKGLADPNLSLSAWRGMNVWSRITGENLVCSQFSSFVTWDLPEALSYDLCRVQI